MIVPLLTGLALAAAPDLPEDGAPDEAWHVRVDTAATWGIGGQMFLGAEVHPTAWRPLWSTPAATGSLDLGVALTYGNEAAFLAPWIDTSSTRGSNHRVQVFGSVGTTFHMGPGRRLGLGLHALVGMNEWISSYAVDYSEEDFSGRATVADTRFVAAGQLTLSWRLSRTVGLDLLVVGQVPLASSYAIGFGHLGVGPCFYLR